MSSGGRAEGGAAHSNAARSPTARSDGSGRVVAVVGAAIIGWALAYGVVIYARLPNVLYDPQRARWVPSSSRPGQVAMGYFGQLLWAAAGALVGATIGWIASRIITPRTDGRGGLAAAWTLTALLLVGAWFTWNNWP